ncbi:cyclodeaminase/cyclohydrolase family protein [bacterium 210820-DFI.6.37]|nr:cyclodeaminase/cyclohydrolase family protein [bacterium 210820-DFI.6.37]
MSYTKESCESFVKVLSSKEPTPGGGGASALVGAVGTALGSMVGSLTIGKKKYKEVEEEIKAMTGQAQILQQELLELVQKDADSFAPLAAAYGMPKDTRKQQEEKERVLEEALKEACSVPFEIMEKCCRGIDLCGEFAEKGSKLAISDAGAGASFCRAALQSASLNIYINTKSVKDRAFAKEANQKADEMLKTYMEKADKIIEQVFAAIR